MEKKLCVERETYEKYGKEFFGYFIKGDIRGKEVRVAVIPPDRGGYAVLDIVYDGGMSADLVVKPYEITDEKTGRVMKGNSYFVQSIDADGEVYECKIKPSKFSDKTLLEMLLKKNA